MKIVAIGGAPTDTYDAEWIHIMNMKEVIFEA